MAVPHRRAQLRLARQAGPGLGETKAAFDERLSALTSDLEEMENELQDAENRFVVQTHGKAGEPLLRARIAFGLGMPGKAIETLAGSNADLYGVEGLRLLLELLIWTGQAADARSLLDRAELKRNPDGLGSYDIPGGAANGRPWGYRLHAYDWFDLCQSAAAGRYVAAAGAAERLRTRLRAQEEIARRNLQRGAAFALASEAMLPASPPAGWRMLYPAREHERLTDFAINVDFLAAARGDLHTLEGLLRLERGDLAAAEQFATAGQVYSREARAAPVRPGQALAERYLIAIRGATR
jgi:hypothetical protein